MNTLMDTHTFLWWMTDDPQLSDVARNWIGDPANRIFVSAASAWEIAIKCGIGKLTLPEPPTVYVRNHVSDNGFGMLSISADHALYTYQMPFHHRDPFDRILIAQSVVERMPIITVDTAFVPYGVATIW